MKNIIVSQWMSPAQYNVLSLCKRGEESAAFQEIERRLIDNIQKCPTTYQQDGLGDNAIVFLHYFNSNNDYYIFETDVGCKDNSPNQFQSQMMALKKELQENVCILPTEYNCTIWEGESDTTFNINKVKKEDVVIRHMAGAQDWNNYKNWI